MKAKMIIYLDDMLLMAASKEELVMGRDTLIFVLQHLGLVINAKKSQLTPTRINRVLRGSYKLKQNGNISSRGKGSKNSGSMSISCESEISVSEGVVSTIGRLSSTTLAILPAPLQYRYLQKQ